MKVEFPFEVKLDLRKNFLFEYMLTMVDQFEKIDKHFLYHKSNIEQENDR